ncbi:MAG: hypothetical protein V3V15_09895 [Sphingorhabdus sp.]
MHNLLLPLLLQSTALPTIDELRLTECIELAEKDAPSAILEGSKWRQENGGWRAEICLATGYARNFEFVRSIPYFERGAEGASAVSDARSNRFWLQAGNAAIAAEKPMAAIRYIDRALAKGALPDAERAEALIDRARAHVDAGQEAQAKTDLFAVRRLAPESTLGWLFSATLARRNGDLEDAQGFISTAARLAPKDPANALEAGNIAAAAGDLEQARKQWELAVTLAPDSRQADTARSRLAKMPRSAEALKAAATTGENADGR